VIRVTKNTTSPIRASVVHDYGVLERRHAKGAAHESEGFPRILVLIGPRVEGIIRFVASSYNMPVFIARTSLSSPI